MIALWRWFVHLLVWLSADPHAAAAEPAKAAAAVAAARASVIAGHPVRGQGASLTLDSPARP